jgi:hypothetical protein
VEGPLRDPRQCLFKVPSCLIVADGLQGALLRFCLEDPFHRVSVESLVPKSMLKRFVDVRAFVVLFHPEDVPGMEACVSRLLFCKPLEERIRCFTQSQEGLSHRFQAVAYPLYDEVVRILHFFTGARGLASVPCDAIDLGAIDEDLLVRRLEAQDISDVARGHGVPVRLEADKPFGVADP